MSKVVSLKEWKEENQPHGVFDCNGIPNGKKEVIVCPISVLQDFVSGHLRIQDTSPWILRCVVQDWLIDNDVEEK